MTVRVAVLDPAPTGPQVGWAVRSHGTAGPAPLRIGPCVRYSKADAFEICGALALAESVLRSLGRATDADLLGSVFEVAEAGLVRSAARQGLGSNSMARELTQ